MLIAASCPSQIALPVTTRSGIPLSEAPLPMLIATIGGHKKEPDAENSDFHTLSACKFSEYTERR
jgi:hypothetical protein